MRRERGVDKVQASMSKEKCNVKRTTAHEFAVGGASPRTGSGAKGACGISSSQATCLPTNVSKNKTEGVIKWAESRDWVRRGGAVRGTAITSFGK